MAAPKKPARRVMIDPEKAKALKAALARTQAGGKGKDPGELRRHVAAVFDQIEADRARDVPWDRLVMPFVELGVRMPDGDPPTAKDLANTYHAERYARGGTREPRKGSAKPKPQPDPPPVTGPKDQSGAATNPVTTPAAAADDGSDLAKLRAALDPSKGRAPLTQAGFDVPSDDPNWRNRKD